eukprot:gene13907-biopygen21603
MAPRVRSSPQPGILLEHGRRRRTPIPRAPGAISLEKRLGTRRRRFGKIRYPTFPKKSGAGACLSRDVCPFHRNLSRGHARSAIAGWVGLDQVGHGWVRPGIWRIHAASASLWKDMISDRSAPYIRCTGARPCSWRRGV